MIVKFHRFSRFSTFQFLLRRAINIFIDFQLSSSSWEWLSNFHRFSRFSTFQLLLRRTVKFFLDFPRFSSFQFLLRRTINIFLDFKIFNFPVPLEKDYQYFPRFSNILKFPVPLEKGYQYFPRFSNILKFPVPLEKGYQYFPRFSRFSTYQYLPRFSTFQFLLNTINIFLDFHDFQLSSSSGAGLSINIYISKIGANFSQKIRNRLELF